MINYDAFVVEIVPDNAYMVAIDDGVFTGTVTDSENLTQGQKNWLNKKF